MITLEKLLEIINKESEIEIYTSDAYFLHGYDMPKTLKNDVPWFILEYVTEIEPYKNTLMIYLDIKENEIFKNIKKC